MKYLRAFKNKQDYSKEIGDKPKIDYSTVSLVLDDESVFFNEYVTREAYFYVTEPVVPVSLEESEATSISPQSLESGLPLIDDYRMFSEIYLNDGTENLVPKLIEGSFTIDADDLEQIDETTWRNTNPKKFNSTYVNSFIVSCDEEILDDYYIGFSGIVGSQSVPNSLNDNATGGTSQRVITLMGTLNELFNTPALKEASKINSNTIDLAHFFISNYELVSSLNVVIFKPGENGDLIPITTKNSYVSNIIEEKTYDVSETPVLEDFLLLDFTLKCEEDILPTDILFSYGNGSEPEVESIEVETIETASSDENNGIVSLGTIEDFLNFANDNGLGVGLIDSKTLGPVNGYVPNFPYIRLCGIMRDGVVLTQKVNIVGINSSEFCNYSLSTDKLGENKIEFKIPNRFRSPSFERSNLIRLNDKALKHNKIIVPYAFYNCGGLESMTIPNTVTSIGEMAFYYCTSLTSITIPNSVTSIGERAFFECGNLTRAIIGDNMATIGDSAFRNCASLKSITIPNSVTSIGERAFQYCIRLTSVTIPDSVTSIENYTFQACYELTNVTIGNGVTSIGNQAFAGCHSLTSVNIPDSVTSIGNQAFYNCIGLTSVTIPDNITSIGERAFESCSSLTNLTIGNGVTPIGDYAFRGCGLTSVTIGNGVTSIGQNAFESCTKLTSIRIPDSVFSIRTSAFQNCTNLTNVTIGNGVTSIGTYVFQKCTSLRSITIPDSVTSFGGSAFDGCSGLRDVTIGNGVTMIGNYTFRNCTSLTSITIPNSVTSIGTQAFGSCSTLGTITCLAKIAPSLISNSFSYIANTGVLRVPTGSDYSTWLSKLPSGWTIEYI